MRHWNFAAGPATIPLAVLEQVREELPDWHGAGCGVMEMSHRGKIYTGIYEQVIADLRKLMDIPEEYAILFLQGGATLQFSQIPMNLLDGGLADYLTTGAWSEKAVKAGQRLYGDAIREAGTSANTAFTCLVDPGSMQLTPNAKYLHFCSNETIGGVEVFDLKQLGAAVRPGIPLIADMSSNILSRPINVRDYGLIYAGAQKNIGPAGVTLVIIRKDLLGKASKAIPALMDYAEQEKNTSMLNTPPTFGIYMSGLVFQWLLKQGGLPAIAKQNQAKAELLYQTIDGSGGFYTNGIATDCRSWMNIPFTLKDKALDPIFLEESDKAGLLALKGHKIVGGMRASIYNAMPMAGVQALVGFMNDFMRRYG
jgi:phosphoserine aminotransferase